MPQFEFERKRPRVDASAWVAPTAVLVGDVEVGEGASIWFGAVIRGDVAPITIGAGTNVQDNAVVHCARGLPTKIGANVTIGHLACLEGCVVEDGAVVGIASVMLQRTRLGKGSMLAAGSVLSEGAEVPAGHLAAGTPAQVKKQLSGSSADWVDSTARHYQEAGRAYKAHLVGVSRD
jgi:carbonic anhydrase/acetyltransferase-like protein (isoleucine patch superfamily)